MNSKFKGIIVCAVVLVCLGATLAILKLTGADTDDSSSESDSSEKSTSSEEDESVQLVDREANDVAELTAENKNGSFTYYRDTETGKETFGIKELDGLELNENMVSDLAEDAAQLTAYKSVEENAEDLAKYGLEEPEAVFTVKFSDGEERAFEIGDEAPQNRYRYLKEKDSNDVYMILGSTVEYYTERKEAFVSTTLLATPEDDEMPDFGTLTVSRSDIDYDIVFKQDSEEVNDRVSDNMASQQVMTEPIFSYLNVDIATDTLYGLYGLTAIEAEAAFPDEDTMAEYGLDDPHTVVTFTGEGYDYKLSIGGEYHDVNEEGEEQSAASAYYCYFEGVDGKDCIYKIDATALPWVTLLPGDIVSSMMTWNMITDVESLKIYGDDADFEMLPTVEEDEDGDEDVASVTVNGDEADVDTFKSLYMYLLNCPTSEVIFELPEGDPYVTLEINCGDHTDKIEFYKDTERRSIAVLNEKTPYRIRSAWVDRLLKNAEAVRDGGEVVDTY